MDPYGVYTAADANFFPGVVVQMNALRLHGYEGKLAVIDTGLDPWMRDYLTDRGAHIVSMDFTNDLRFTDVLSDERAGMWAWSFKAFGIMHARLFRSFTFIDADYIPLCNLQEELHARIEGGEFLSTEDGWNTWTDAHTEAVGVRPGTYMNINAGFFSASMEHHGALLEEWRNLMTRRKPFDLWHGDQGALNAVLDKYDVPKALVGEKSEWNQTWLNEKLAREDSVVVDCHTPPVLRFRDGRRIFGWHGCGWYRYWHGIGIDHYRNDSEEIERMERECLRMVPNAVLEIFSGLLFRDNDLVVNDHLLRARAPEPGSLADIYARSYQGITDKGTAHSYIAVYERLLEPYRTLDITLLEIGVWQGGSLLLWADYFPSGRIVGMDVNLSAVLAAVHEVSQIVLIEGNATRAECIDRAISGVDIVIDDGSHVIEEQLSSFLAIAPRLRAGGLYVIEDIWPFENALRLHQEIPGSQIIDRRSVKGRLDDVLLVYKKSNQK
jgi:hypothetical protein